MEVMWFVIVVILTSIAMLLKGILDSNFKPKKLPPGPRSVPIIGPIYWLRKSWLQIEASLRSLWPKFGPMVTIQGPGSRPFIFIASHSLAHQALIQNGAVFADRPDPLPIIKIASNNQHNISSASYGPLWRLLRCNFTAHVIHPSHSHTRTSALHILLERLNIVAAKSSSYGVVKLRDHFQFTMFGLLVGMCFGGKLDEHMVTEIEAVQHRFFVSFHRFVMLNLWPRITRILLRKRWDEFFSLRKKQEEVMIPLIRARKQRQEQGSLDRNDNDDNNKFMASYVDSLLTLELQVDDDNNNNNNNNRGKRKLTESEMVTICSEFLNAGTDTTSTALEWIMANLVKYPHIQSKLIQEIKGVLVIDGQAGRLVKEVELSKMPYLKAVVLEGLRRHPPTHFSLPHSVTQEVEFGGYTIPKDAVMLFVVSSMGWDPEVWDDPMKFKPERFLSSDPREEIDITGSRKITMMPFGVGRRMCPGYSFAIHLLEYFVANLVWNFEWKAIDGDEIDLSEKQELTVVMKHPLHAQISPRQCS